MDLRENIDLIKIMIRKFPGIVLGLHRQVGKSTAILELVHDDHHGEADVACVNGQMADILKNRYREMYPKEKVPNFVVSARGTRGSSRPIFSDEWWLTPINERRDLLGTGRLRARIGTELGLRNLDSSVIRFTDEELACLDAMFDVLINGGGNYMMLGLPDTVKVHRDLKRKFHDAYEESKRE